MNSRPKSPLFAATVALALVGALLPVLSLIRGGGLRGTLNDAGLLAMVWGASPFALLPVAARLARRPWVQKMVLALAAIAGLAGAVNHFVIVPRLDPAEAPKVFFLAPIWQWPVAVLAAALAVFVPSVEDERRMSAEAPEAPEPPAAGA